MSHCLTEVVSKDPDVDMQSYFTSQRCDSLERDTFFKVNLAVDVSRISCFLGLCVWTAS